MPSKPRRKSAGPAGGSAATAVSRTARTARLVVARWSKDEDTWKEAHAAWQAEIGTARRDAAGSGLDDVGRVRARRTDEFLGLRWIYTHMIEEYARPHGHARLRRERIDGATGD